MSKYRKLESVLEERNVSIKQLAGMTGIHAQDIYQAIIGTKMFWKGWKRRIAEALEVPVEDLFEQEAE